MVPDAISINKLILQLQPQNMEVYENLAECYHSLGYVTEAIKQYKHMAEIISLTRTGDYSYPRLKILELEPDNISIRIALGQFFHEQNYLNEAIHEYTYIAQYYKRVENEEKFIEVVEKLTDIQPDTNLLKDLVDCYLKKQETDLAIKKLELCAERDTKNTNLLVYLAATFQNLEQYDSSMKILKKLISVHLENNDPAAAKEVWLTILELEELKAEQSKQEQLEAEQNKKEAEKYPEVNTPNSKNQPDLAVNRRLPVNGNGIPLKDKTPLGGLSRDIIITPEPFPNPIESESRRSVIVASVKEEPEDSVEFLLKESDSCLKYGSLNLALEHLRKVMSIDPQNPHALDRARTIFESPYSKQLSSDERLWLSHLVPTKEEVVPPRSSGISLASKYDLVKVKSFELNSVYGGSFVIPEFWIARYPVTNKEYFEFVRETNELPPYEWYGNKPPVNKLNHPVIGVKLSEVTRYAEWRGLRIPTNLEWEAAARSPDNRNFPWGNSFQVDLCNCYESRESTGTTSIKEYPKGSSSDGCVDLVGNVWEWTTNDPQAPEPEPGYLWVLGGSYKHRCDSGGDLARTAVSADNSYGYLGFRCALDC